MGACRGVLQIQAYKMSYGYACFTLSLSNLHVRTYIHADVVR